jgi:formate hydrogenlyase subunit 3/multisubunit Na+/H+ antiporter MnhD subunit
MLSALGIFFLINSVFQELNFRLIGVVIAITASIVAFFIFKKRIITRTTFKLNSDQFFVEDRFFDFKEVQYYKTHRMKGAGLTIKLKNGRKIRFSANDNFCNTEEFVAFVNEFEVIAMESWKIKKKRTFGETKFGLFFAIISTLVLIYITIYQMQYGESFELSNIAMMILALSIVWSGTDINKILKRQQ